MSNIQKLNHYRKFIFIKVMANLKAEASRYYLSYLWWIFEPILHMMTYYLVFGLLLRQGTENYVVFLLTGIIPMIWFNRTVSNSTMSIISGKMLMMQVHIPKIVFPTITIFQDSIKEMVVMILLLLFLLFYGISPSPCWSALPVLMVTQILLNSAFAYLVASIIPFMADLQFLVSTGLQMLFFVSGVFFNDTMIPAAYHKFFYMNPMATLLHNYRAIFLDNQWPDWQALLYLNCGALIGIAIMTYVIGKLDHLYPRIVL